ncbi:MAG: GNAT family N-acetyltransferase [Anaerolineales bacterium]|nr:GNAT family N-acetyltransferase [Anaerolineales bacterium]
MKTSLPEGYTFRHPSLEDAPALVELFNADSLHQLGVAKHTLEEQVTEFEAPDRDLRRDFYLVIAPGGEIVGYEEVWGLIEPFTPLTCWGRVHPHYAGQGIGTHMLGWAEQRARQAIPLAPADARVMMAAFCLSIDKTSSELFLSQGFELIRHSLRMVITLDQAIPEPLWPSGITLRTVASAEDERAAFIAGRDAFRDHYGHVERPVQNELATFEHHLRSDPEYDPALWFLALDGDEIAGSSRCRRKIDDDPEMGWVSSLSVRRPWRKQGLGLALLLHSFREFSRRGCCKVGLGVDAQNLTGALRLYEKAGMRSDPNRQFSIFEKELRPGVDLANRG